MTRSHEHITPVIDEIAGDLEGDLIALRRDIYRNPELAGEERRTAALAADRLRAVGLTVTVGVGGHGVVAVLEGAGDGPTVAYRADLDAVGPHARLPYPSSGRVFDADFASEVPDVAHLCGHDLHTAIGVGVAEALWQIRDRLPGRVVFIFQPAEETISGARAMIEAGVLERYAPHEIYAVHCGPFPVGTFVAMPGLGLPGADEFTVELSGPDAAADANRLAAAIASLSTVDIPPTLEGYERILADVQRPDTSLARFVTVRCGPDSADGRASVRGAAKAWPDDRYPLLRDEIRAMARSVGATVEFPPEPFPAMVCSPGLSEFAATYLRRALGPDSVTLMHAAPPFYGEDFALFLQAVPGAMFFLGVANPAMGINGSPHMPDFAADERAIRLGVRAMAGLLSSRLMLGADA